jgi:dihydropteroate synthase
MNAILRKQQERGVGTGLERKERWKTEGKDIIETVAEPGNEKETLAGNSANAALAATDRADAVRSSRLFGE